MIVYILLGVVGVVLIIVFLLSDSRENRNRLAAKFQKGGHVARAERNIAEAGEVVSSHTLAHAQQRSDEARELELMSHHNQRLGYQNQELVINEATAMKVSPAMYETIIQKQKFNQLDHEKELADLKARIAAAIALKHLSNVQTIGLLTEAIDSMYRQIDNINADTTLSERARQRMKDDREETITAYKEFRRDRERLLLEGDTGGAGGSFDEDSDT